MCCTMFFIYVLLILEKSLVINSATVWATPFARDRLTAHSTKEVGRLMNDVLPNSEYPVYNQKRITYIYRCSECEGEVKHDTHAS